MRACGARGGIARGLGRAYGDAAQNAGGAVLDMTGLDRVRTRSTPTAARGVRRGRLPAPADGGAAAARLVVAVSPGTRYVTVGGAIGADIHGKNHHVSGSFTGRVTVPGAAHRRRARSARSSPGTALFDATAGGMGLTGVILSATIRLQPRRDLADVGRHRARRATSTT
ncbi:Decaprenylphosphoryl-beta-D-ribose oxidase [Streptomyces antimycoticus]